MFFRNRVLAISIHAPARGATIRSTPVASAPEISIHAPARGATTTACASLCTAEHFNPRAREGRDDQCRDSGVELFYFNPRAREGRDPREDPKSRQIVISIHAPARGATPASTGSCATPRFQSTRPRGARLFPFSRSRQSRRFQSTRPRGARPRQSRRLRSTRNFNPRAREGRDDFSQNLITYGEISIHAPARGATHGCGEKENAPEISIHAPARGATDDLILCTDVAAFQSTRPRGARRERIMEEDNT